MNEVTHCAWCSERLAEPVPFRPGEVSIHATCAVAHAAMQAEIMGPIREAYAASSRQSSS